MARVNYLEAKEMASKGGNLQFNFLSLKDGESKRVRFLHASIEDIPAYSAHSVKVNVGGSEKFKNVNCLRSSNEPVQKCPLCAIGNKPRARIYLALTDETNTVYIWERSGQFLEEMEGYFTRYGDLRNHLFDIERRGTGLNTKYNIFPLGQNIVQDKSTLPAIPDVFGVLVLDKDYNDINTFINTGTFPEKVTSTTQQTNQQQPQYQRREQVMQQAGFQQQPQQPSYSQQDINPWGQQTTVDNNTPRRGW